MAVLPPDPTMQDSRHISSNDENSAAITKNTTTLSTGWREVYWLLDCETSVEPDPVSSDPADAAVRQAVKHARRRSS